MTSTSEMKVVRPNQPLTSNYSVEIIVPTFEEGDELRLAVERLISTLAERGISKFVVTIVIDGPIKKTIDAAALVTDQRVRTLVLPMNKGKGNAVLTGFRQSRADVLGFIDGDLDIHPDALIDAIRELSDPQNVHVGCVYGSKFHQQSVVSYPLIRRVLSRGFRAIIRILFSINVDDTQTGVKMFRRSAIEKRLDTVTQSGFLLDIELMKIVADAGWSLLAVPVNVKYHYSSTVSPRVVAQMFIQTLKLAARKSTRPNSQA